MTKNITSFFFLPFDLFSVTFLPPSCNVFKHWYDFPHVHLSIVELFWGVNAAFHFIFSYYPNVPLFLPIKVTSVYSIALENVLKINLICHFEGKGMLTLIPLGFPNSLIYFPDRVIDYRIILKYLESVHLFSC